MSDLMRRIAADRGPRLDLLLLAGLALLTLALRAPGLGAPLGIDEGGMAIVGEQWLGSLGHGTGQGTLYGGAWLDRPPLLLLAYGVTDLVGGALGVRLLGAGAAVLLVAAVAIMARRVGGRRAMLAASVLAACTVSSPVLRGDMTYGELLAAVPVAFSVLLLTLVSTGSSRLGWAPGRARAAVLAAAGLLAVCGPLYKQSAIDAVAAAALWFAWRAGLAWQARDAAGPTPARSRVRAHMRASHSTETARSIAADAAAWFAGALAPVAATFAWAATTPGGVRDVGYALFGFRLDLVAALGAQSTPPLERALGLLPALLGSGLFVVVLLVPAGVLAARVPGRGTGIAMLLGGWMAGATFGVAGGGYYWGHYLLQLVGPAAVLAGLALAGHRRLLPAATLPVLVLAVVAPVVTAMAPAQLPPSPAAAQADPVAMGELLRLNGRPGDRVAVLYARANVPYYAGMRPATPYGWSSMYRTIPDARTDLLAALAGPRRAAWVVEWQRVRSFGMDRDGHVRRALTAGYRTVAVMCDHRVLLRRDRPLPVVTMPTETCVHVGSDGATDGAAVAREPAA